MVRGAAPRSWGGVSMRRFVLATVVALAATAGLAACGSSGSTSSSSSSSSTNAAVTSCTYASIQQELYHHGVLTVATDKPAYPPWFENNDPANGKGYDSAIARQLGFKPAQVQWSYEPFNDSYAPGLKKFDFDINEISYTPQRATAVTFSNSYYDDHQALVALKSTPIVTKHAPADLKRYIFGGQIGTTSLAYITTEIQPTARPKVFQTLNDVKEALQTNQIAALVTDTPTARYISSSEIPNSLTVAQFPSTGEHYGLLFSKGNPLVTCANKAIGTLTASTTLTALQKQYLHIHLTVPTIQP